MNAGARSVRTRQLPLLDLTVRRRGKGRRSNDNGRVAPATWNGWRPLDPGSLGFEVSSALVELADQIPKGGYSHFILRGVMKGPAELVERFSVLLTGQINSSQV